MIIYLHKYLGIILLVTLCVIALINYDKYGLGWDENEQRKTGIVSAEYVFSNNQLFQIINSLELFQKRFATGICDFKGARRRYQKLL